VIARTLMCDVECYRDYFLVKFLGSDGSVVAEFEQFDGHPLDIEGTRRVLLTHRIITFNGNHYDMPVMAYALSGATCAQLKQAGDMIIHQNMQPWQFYDQMRVDPIPCDHIDLIEVAPGQGSLKAYGGKMHSKRLQDLPYDPSASIGWAERVNLRDYCGNDLQTTLDLFNTFPAQIALREQMSAEYDIDLRSKSDAQIAEAVMKSLLSFKVERPYIAPGSTFYYRPPAWLKFSTPTLQRVFDLVLRSPFTVGTSGSSELTAELENTHVTIGNSTYTVRGGGLHSKEQNIIHVSDDEYVITDHDVASYYPSLILITGIYPTQIGEQFRHIYQQWYDRRLAAKRAGDKKTANSLKTLLNGTFGKLGSKWSIFYAPSELIQVTVTGQLALLMLIEMLELSGISVISANTDGIVLRTRRDLEWLRDSIIQWWEQATGFETERTDYRLVASRDVNNYVAVKTDGEVKLKGDYAPPEPGASGWPNPSGQICVDAVVAYLTKGMPLEKTIRECTDIRRFVYTVKVTGGGSFASGGLLEKKPSKRKMVEVAGSEEAYHAQRDVQLRDLEYLGKVVRWYYPVGATGQIVRTMNGNKVGLTDGCAPLMELPDTLPGDIDYQRYLSIAQGLLVDLGVIATPHP